MFHADKPLPPPPPPHRSSGEAHKAADGGHRPHSSSLVSDRIAAFATSSSVHNDSVPPRVRTTSATPPKLPAKPTHLARTPLDALKHVSPAKSIETNNNNVSDGEPALSASATRQLFERFAASAEHSRPVGGPTVVLPSSTHRKPFVATKRPAIPSSSISPPTVVRPVLPCTPPVHRDSVTKSPDSISPPTVIRPTAPSPATYSSVSKKPSLSGTSSNVVDKHPTTIVRPAPPPPPKDTVSTNDVDHNGVVSSRSVKDIRNQLSAKLAFGGRPVVGLDDAIPTSTLSPSGVHHHHDGGGDTASSAPTIVRPHPSHYATTAATFDPDYDSSTGHRRRRKSPPARPPPPRLKHRNSLNELQPHAIALYAFKGQQFDELSCQKGDVILLKRRVNAEWFYGENKSGGGAFGIVPSSFLDVKLPPPDEPLSVPHARTDVKRALSPDIDSGNESMHSQHSNIDSGPRCVAIFVHNSEHAGDLSFRQHDMIRLLSRVNDEWLEGETQNGRRGIFPAQFVRIIEDLQTSKPPKSTDGGSAAIVTALYDYHSSNDGDLMFKAGDEIVETAKINKEWCQGYLRSNPSVTGIYPATFVKHTIGTAQPGTAFSKNSPKTGGGGGAAVGELATALFDYRSEDAGDLWFSAGDRIRVTEHVNADWLRGKLVLEQVNSRALPAGLFPASFVHFPQDDARR